MIAAQSAGEIETGEEKKPVNLEAWMRTVAHLHGPRGSAARIGSAFALRRVPIGLTPLASLSDGSLMD